MDDLRGKVAIVTGASSGIGAAIVKELLQLGMKVVGLARRKEKIEELRKGFSGNLYAVQTDVTKENDIIKAFKWTEENVGPVYVLINNAGVGYFTPINEAETEKVKQVLDTNLLAVTLFTREAVKSMKANNIDGFVINVNSTAGHYISAVLTGTAVYTASKFGVTAFTESIRGELAKSRSQIRITSLSPGLVETEATAAIIDQYPHLQSEDIARAVTYILSQPRIVNVAELTIRPTLELI